MDIVKAGTESEGESCKMPRKGYKSITIPEHIFDYFNDDYQANKDAYAIRGVRSFSGYLTMKLNELIEQQKQAAKGNR